jgi:hypothetical protein
MISVSPVSSRACLRAVMDLMPFNIQPIAASLSSNPDFADAGAVPWRQQPPAQQAAGAVAAVQKALGSAAAELLVARLAAAAAVDPAAEAAAPHSELTTQQVLLLCGLHARSAHQGCMQP